MSTRLRARATIPAATVLLVVFAGYSLFPLIWMLLTSFKPEVLAREIPPRWLPDPFTLENYVSLIKDTLILRHILNSLGLGLATICAVVAVAVPAGYAFARLPFRGSEALFLALLMSVMVSGVTTLAPLYLIMLRFRLVNTYWSLLLVYTAQVAPISIWMFRAFFQTIPLEMEEAAQLDGCTRLGVLTTIVLPNSKPAIAAVSMYAFVAVWREFLLAATFITKQEMKTLPVAIYMFFQETGIEWAGLGAAVVLACIPTFVLFSLFLRWFNPGAVAGAIK